MPPPFSGLHVFVRAGEKEAEAGLFRERRERGGEKSNNAALLHTLYLGLSSSTACMYMVPLSLSFPFSAIV